MAKSPSEIVEHVAPSVPGVSDIPPVPPLPVIPPVPPLPVDVVPVTEDDGRSGTDAVDAEIASADVGSADIGGDVAVSEHDAWQDESGERPPLPEISAEDAALQFETRPDAAEQATGLENHEPMKFVWSKRWPFLSLVPVDEAAAVAATDIDGSPNSAASDDDADRASDNSGATAANWFTGGNTDDTERSTETVLVDDGIRVDDSNDDSLTADSAIDDAAPEYSLGDDAVTETRVLDDDVRGAQDADTPFTGNIVDEGTVVDTDVTADADDTATTEWSWLDDPAPATNDPIADDVTIALLVQDESVTEVFAPGAAATALLPTPNQETDSVPTTAEDTGFVQDADEHLPAATAGLIERETFDVVTAGEQAESSVVLNIRNVSRSFGDTVAVNGIDLDVHKGSFYGIVGPNGAGKTTTLSMITGLLRPDSGTIRVNGIDVWQDPEQAKRTIGVLPDRLRLFDRLTGAQLLYYSGVLRGLDGATVRSRVKDLASAFGLEDALNRLVTDYSAGMTKKVALASAMIHSPRLLVLDEPFESVDPVSAANVIEILQGYVAHGGTVVLSSHGMDLIQRVCDHVAIVVNGQVLDAGSVDDVRGSGTLEDRFVELAGGRKAAEGMEWLHSFSD